MSVSGRINPGACAFSASAILLRAEISDHFTKKNVREKQWRFSDIRRLFRLYWAWKLVTKCLRNLRKWQFPTCFLPFPLTFPRFSQSVFIVSSFIVSTFLRIVIKTVKSLELISISHFMALFNYHSFGLFFFSFFLIPWRWLSENCYNSHIFI